jgi:hypothetical protein
MPITIKNRGFSTSRAKALSNQVVSKTNPVGWMPGYEQKFEGTGIKTTSKQYQENYDKIDWSKK